MSFLFSLKTAVGKEELTRKSRLLKIVKTDTKNILALKACQERELYEIDRDLSDFLQLADKIYEMDDDDETGWLIYKTLIDRREICKWMIASLQKMLVNS